MLSAQVFHHKYRPHSAQMGQSLAWLIRLWFLQHVFLALAIDGQSRAQNPTCIFDIALYPVCVTMLSATCKSQLMDLLVSMPFIHLHILKSPSPAYKLLKTKCNFLHREPCRIYYLFVFLC